MSTDPMTAKGPFRRGIHSMYAWAALERRSRMGPSSMSHLAACLSSIGEVRLATQTSWWFSAKTSKTVLRHSGGWGSSAVETMFRAEQTHPLLSFPVCHRHRSHSWSRDHPRCLLGVLLLVDWPDLGLPQKILVSRQFPWQLLPWEK